MSQIQIRQASVADSVAIMQIYNHEVEHSTSTFDLQPRSEQAQRAWIDSRSGALSVLVAETIDAGVIGFAGLSKYRERAAYNSTVENSVYVDRKHRRCGVGKLLLTNLLDIATTSGFHTVIARIDPTNTASTELHEALGFVPVGVEREIGRKFGRWLDSAILQKML